MNDPSSDDCGNAHGRYDYDDYYESYEPRARSYGLLPTGHWLLATSYRLLLAMSYELLPTGHWVLPTGHWNYWLLA